MSDDLLNRLGLRMAAEGIPASNPDSELMADLVAAADLRNDREAAYKNWNAPPAKRVGSRADAKAAFMLASRAQEAIELRIVGTPARTDAGTVEKLRFALARLGGGADSPMCALPASTRHITEHALAAKGLDVDPRVKAKITENVRQAMARLAAKGVVRKLIQWPEVWWELAA